MHSMVYYAIIALVVLIVCYYILYPYVDSDEDEEGYSGCASCGTYEGFDIADGGCQSCAKPLGYSNLENAWQHPTTYNPTKHGPIIPPDNIWVYGHGQ